VFDLSDEYEALRASVRRLAEDGIAPNAAAADEREEFPAASWSAWREAGFPSLPFPEAYGGQGGGALAHAIAVEEVARVCASSSLFTFISKLGMSTVLDHGSEELKEKYVRPVAAGDAQASYCLSEVDAGSDVAGMQTRARRDGDHYVLTGRKHWITNAGVSDYYTVFAKTDPDAGHRGISAFVVESTFPGFSIGKLERKLGVRGSPTGEVVLDDCIVPAANLVGDEGRGFAYAMGALDRSRPLVGAQALGIAQGALDLAAQYVQDRSQFGKRIADFQGVQFMLADMATHVDAARLLIYRACARLDAGRTDTASASSMGKLFASDTAMRVATDCVQLLGGVGYTKDMPAERFMRDAKITQIYEGTNQIQRIVIAKRLLSA
jgi:alkylation response protein AidB-like acyl-CoA dehydrogenase